jgi:hypothetical protein
MMTTMTNDDDGGDGATGDDNDDEDDGGDDNNGDGATGDGSWSAYEFADRSRVDNCRTYDDSEIDIGGGMFHFMSSCRT